MKSWYKLAKVFNKHNCKKLIRQYESNSARVVHWNVNRDVRHRYHVNTRPNNGRTTLRIFNRRIALRVAEVAGLPANRLSTLSITRSDAPHGSIGYHLDADRKGEHSNRSHTTHTLLVSLNKNYLGGKLVFKSRRLRYAYKTGEGFMFTTANDVHHFGSFNQLLHKSTRLSFGSKYLLLCFFHNKKTTLNPQVKIH